MSSEVVWDITPQKLLRVRNYIARKAMCIPLPILLWNSSMNSKFSPKTLFPRPINLFFREAGLKSREISQFNWNNSSKHAGTKNLKTDLHLHKFLKDFSQSSTIGRFNEGCWFIKLWFLLKVYPKSLYLIYILVVSFHRWLSFYSELIFNNKQSKKIFFSFNK